MKNAKKLILIKLDVAQKRFERQDVVNIIINLQVP
jgi:hypothetical protein